MAKLTSAQRNALPSSAFALPKQRKFPMEDAAHVANAKARATQSGNPRIKAAVARKARTAGRSKKG
jgi:hypothetical protein